MTDWFSIAVWSLFGTWVLVVGTLILMYWQTRTSQRLNSANAVMALRERFDSAHMRAARRHLSARLLAHAHDDISSVDVVTFFELVGALTHHGVLDAELVWEAFGSWIVAYYWAIRHPDDLVRKTREELHDPLVFHEFEWLHDTVVSIDVHREPQSPPSGDNEAASRRILELETKLAPS
ncbi:MAG TPA: hypothetical protein VEE86_01615 [Thermoplasmata archaeon]|nr:hypothetical protein [Thermoplasmata archaeon]